MPCSGKTTITSLHNTRPRSLGRVRIASPTNPAIKSCPPNIRTSARSQTCDSSLRQREPGQTWTFKTTRSVSVAGSSSSGAALTVFLRRSSRDFYSLHAVCHGSLGTGAFVSTAGHGTPEFQRAMAAKGARPPGEVWDARERPRPLRADELAETARSPTRYLKDQGHAVMARSTAL